MITRVAPEASRTTRDWLEPMMSRQRMSTCAGSSSPSVVMIEILRCDVESILKQQPHRRLVLLI